MVDSKTGKDDAGKKTPVVDSGRPAFERRSGKDRRVAQEERRDKYRFEPDADPRRSGKDRRKENVDWQDTARHRRGGGGV